MSLVPLAGSGKGRVGTHWSSQYWSPVSSWSQITKQRRKNAISVILGRQENQTYHTPLSLAAFVTWCTILLPIRKGTSFTESGWIAAGIDYNPAQFCLIEAYNNRQVLHYILTTGICSVTVALVLFGEPFPVSGFPATTSELSPQQYRFERARWSPLEMLCRKISSIKSPQRNHSPRRS